LTRKGYYITIVMLYMSTEHEGAPLHIYNNMFEGGDGEIQAG